MEKPSTVIRYVYMEVFVYFGFSQRSWWCCRIFLCTYIKFVLCAYGLYWYVCMNVWVCVSHTKPTHKSVTYSFHSGWHSRQAVWAGSIISSPQTAASPHVSSHTCMHAAKRYWLKHKTRVFSTTKNECKMNKLKLGCRLYDFMLMV